MHWLALLTVACTLPLIFVGALVTTHDAALSVPDWPTSYGYNMFLFPLSKMVGGIFYEHSHRLIGSLVGALTVALTVWAWMRERRREVRILAAVALVGVIAQGVLGGLRVLLANTDLAIVHACMAQTFFCIAIALALVTGGGWKELGVSSRPTISKLRGLAVITTAAIYMQLILGAITRHTHAMTSAHIVGAVVVVALVARTGIEAMMHHGSDRALIRPGLAMLGFTMVQLFVGLGALALRAARDADLPLTPWQVMVPTVHVALGALILGTSVVLALRAYKVLGVGGPTLGVGSGMPLSARGEARA